MRTFTLLSLMSFLALSTLGVGCKSDDESPTGDGGSTQGPDGGGESGTGSNAGTGGGAGTAADGGKTDDKDAGTGAADKDAGGSSAEPGPGIDDAAAELHCLAEQASDAAALVFGIKKQCFLWDKKDGDFTTTEATNYGNACTVMYKGTLVDECPAEGRVAYCAGTPLTAAGYVNETKIIYESLVNASAETVARNEAGVCQSLNGYDLNDAPLDAKCSGKLEAKVDGMLVDFSANLVCLFKSDGTSHSLLVRGTDKTNSLDGKELTLNIKHSAGTTTLAGELGQPGAGYLEGSTAYGFPAGGSTPTIDATTFETDGSGVSGTFEIGSIGRGPSSTGADQRTITEGTVNVTFE